ncbi:cysteine and glycine-rich protein [Clonorchis sinensis]|uniref:Cysteine and glycine-rich protein n=1 Tax=Clonorchis sinensis TaxID=79923 RepID=G7Y8X6_CLOSI|nr:cysteine and glycine-rich protein [Clonorchis sinensis]
MFCIVLGDMYCRRHHPKFLSVLEKKRKTLGQPVCFICDRPVDEPEPLTGPCGAYHGGCFRCNGCRRILSYDRYKVIQAKFYCEPNCETYMNGHTDDVAQKIDAFKKERYSKEMISAHRSTFIQKCSKCSLEIGSNEQVTVLDRNYHRDCLSCRRCNRVLLEPQHKAIEEFPCCIPDCRVEREVTGSPKVPSEPALPPNLPIKRTPSPRPRSNSVSSSKPGRTAENPKVCVANPERVARLQRKLEEIQTMALEAMNCYICGKKVYPAERLSILKRIYHVNCFRCKACNKPLGGGRYQILKKDPYCMPHYKQLSEIRSSTAINLNIQDTAGDRAIPVVPFIPTKEIVPTKSNEHYTDLTSSPYIQPPIQHETPVLQDKTGIFQPHHLEEPLCYVCEDKVYPAEQLNILSRTYHRTCFRCHTCRNQLDIGRFGVIEGVPYCNAHYRQAYMVQSGKPNSTNPKLPRAQRVSSRPVNEQNGTKESSSCYRCANKVHPADQLCIMKRIYHKSCFKCGVCQRVLNSGRYGVHDGVPYCTAHYKQVVNMRTGSFSSISTGDAAFLKSSRTSHQNSCLSTFSITASRKSVCRKRPEKSSTDRTPLNDDLVNASE